VLWDPECAGDVERRIDHLRSWTGTCPSSTTSRRAASIVSLYQTELRRKQSLVGMFDRQAEGTKIAGTDIESSGSAKCDAYLWALEKYMDRCSKTHIAYTLDGAGTDAVTNVIYQRAEGTDSRYNQIPSHDYYVYHRMFFFDLTPDQSRSAPVTTPTSRANTDRKTLELILQTMYDRSGGEMVQLLGFPPWWMKYTTFRGQRQGGACYPARVGVHAVYNHLQLRKRSGRGASGMDVERLGLHAVQADARNIRKQRGRRKS
jgi:hypothetical protein